MKKIALLTLAILLIAGAAYAKDYKVKKKAGEYEVSVKIDRNPPVVGINKIEIEIKDSAGKYVTDAKVIVDYGMHAMPGMPAMFYKTETELKGNEYKGKMNISMSGPWVITIKITRAGKSSSMQFTIDVK